MKFGKEIIKMAEVTASTLVAPDMWLDYKSLKKIIKLLTPNQRDRDGTNIVEVDGQEKQLRANKDEREFFMKIRRELQKVSRCYTDLELQSCRKVEEMKLEYAKLIVHNETDTAKLEAFMKKCVVTHLHLLTLENYAVLNYAGFIKILKKHDKVTGFTTKEKFLINLVNAQPFSCLNTLGKAIESVESQFTQLKSVSANTGPKDSDLHAPKLNSAPISLKAVQKGILWPSNQPGLPVLPFAFDTSRHRILLAHHEALQHGNTDWLDNAMERTGTQSLCSASSIVNEPNMKKHDAQITSSSGISSMLDVIASQAQRLLDCENSKSVLPLLGESPEFSSSASIRNNMEMSSKLLSQCTTKQISRAELVSENFPLGDTSKRSYSFEDVNNVAKFNKT